MTRASRILRTWKPWQMSASRFRTMAETTGERILYRCFQEQTGSGSPSTTAPPTPRPTTRSSSHSTHTSSDGKSSTPLDLQDSPTRLAISCTPTQRAAQQQPSQQITTEDEYASVR